MHRLTIIFTNQLYSHKKTHYSLFIMSFFQFPMTSVCCLFYFCLVFIWFFWFLKGIPVICYSAELIYSRNSKTNVDTKEQPVFGDDYQWIPCPYQSSSCQGCWLWWTEFISWSCKISNTSKYKTLQQKQYKIFNRCSSHVTHFPHSTCIYVTSHAKKFLRNERTASERTARERMRNGTAKQMHGWRKYWHGWSQTETRLKKLFARMKSHGYTDEENSCTDKVKRTHGWQKFLNGCSQTDTRLTKYNCTDAVERMNSKIFEQMWLNEWTSVWQTMRSITNEILGGKVF